MADRYGWDTAVTYQTNPLASNSEDERRIKCAIKEAKSLQDEKIKTLKLSGIDLRNLTEIFEIALSGHISLQGFPTTQQDITSRLPVSNATDLATGPQIVKHQFHHLPLQGSQGSIDLPNRDTCQTLTSGDNMIEHFEEDFCFPCEENLFNVSDIEDHQSSTTPEPCLKR